MKAPALKDLVAKRERIQNVIGSRSILPRNEALSKIAEQISSSQSIGSCYKYGDLVRKRLATSVELELKSMRRAYSISSLSIVDDPLKIKSLKGLSSSFLLQEQKNLDSIGMRHFLDTRNILWRNILNENLNAINTRITERIKGNDRNSAFSSINLQADQCLLTASHALSAILNYTHASEEDAVPIFHEPEVNKESSSNFVKESITPMGDVTKASQNVEDELLKTARSWDEYTFLLCKKHNINPLIVIFLACLFPHVLGAFINRLVQPPDHTEQIIQCLENLTLEIRSFRRTIEQKLPENPKGYLRVVTRRVKFTTNDNQVIFLNCEDKIFVEYDAKKYVCGTVLIDGKFIKGYCLKKYTKRVIE